MKMKRIPRIAVKKLFLIVPDISDPPKADVALFDCGVEVAVEEINSTDNMPDSLILKEFGL